MFLYAENEINRNGKRNGDMMDLAWESGSRCPGSFLRMCSEHYLSAGNNFIGSLLFRNIMMTGILA